MKGREQARGVGVRVRVKRQGRDVGGVGMWWGLGLGLKGMEEAWGVRAQCLGQGRLKGGEEACRGIGLA